MLAKKKEAEIIRKLSDREREEILNRVEQKAALYMERYSVCGQVVLQALQEEFNLPGGSVVIKAAGFTNLGIARMQYVCGALLGGIMALGLAAGREDFGDAIYPEPIELDEATSLPSSLIVVRKFCQRFVQEFGSWTCRDLQLRLFGRNYETMVVEEEEAFAKAGGHLRCVKMVGRTARLAAEAILELPRR